MIRSVILILAYVACVGGFVVMLAGSLYALWERRP